MCNRKCETRTKLRHLRIDFILCKANKTNPSKAIHKSANIVRFFFGLYSISMTLKAPYICPLIMFHHKIDQHQLDTPCNFSSSETNLIHHTFRFVFKISCFSFTAIQETIYVCLGEGYMINLCINKRIL